MSIQFRYEKCERYTDDRIEVFANEASVGTLSNIAQEPKWLNWFPDEKNYNVAFQFRREETFFEVVDELKRYKDAHGYEYITIWSFSGGFVAKLDIKMLEKAGFHHIRGKHPDCMFLE